MAGVPQPGQNAGVPSPVLEFLTSLHEEFRTVDDGDVATYIPELGRADPS